MENTMKNRNLLSEARDAVWHFGNVLDRRYYTTNTGHFHTKKPTSDELDNACFNAINAIKATQLTQREKDSLIITLQASEVFAAYNKINQRLSEMLTANA